MNGLEKFISSCKRVIKPINDVTSSVGMVLLAAMMFLTAFDVFLRYSLNMPIIGSYEMIQFMLAIAVALGLSYCTFEKGHVNIDVLITRLSPRTQAILNSVTGFLGLVMIALMTWQTCVYILIQIKTNMYYQTLLIPVYPFIAIVAFGIAFYFVALVLYFLESLVELKKK